MESQPQTGIAEILSKVMAATFDRPLVTNVLRGHLAESIIATALEPEWQWCSEDYASWDFERADGVRLEVKQSAAKQSWATSNKPSVCSFDIKPRTGFWQQGEGGQDWVHQPGRQAHLYVFAHHAVADDSADHRNPTQWQFFVVAAKNLPGTQRISLAALERLTASCNWAELRDKVAHIATDSAV